MAWNTIISMAGITEMKVTIVADRVRFMKITSDPLTRTKVKVKSLTTTTNLLHFKLTFFKVQLRNH